MGFCKSGFNNCISSIYRLYFVLFCPFQLHFVSRTGFCWSSQGAGLPRLCKANKETATLSVFNSVLQCRKRVKLCFPIHKMGLPKIFCKNKETATHLHPKHVLNPGRKEVLMFRASKEEQSVWNYCQLELFSNLNWCHSCFSSGKLTKGEFVNDLCVDLELYGFTYHLYPDRVMDRDMLASTWKMDSSNSSWSCILNSLRMF